MTIVSRRAFLAAGAAGLVLGAVRLRPAAASVGGPVFLSARSDLEGGHGVAAFRLDGSVRFEQPLPQRAHGAALRPGGAEVAVFARRPGAYLAVFDARDGTPRHRVAAAPGRLFYGHGVYSADGRLLYATESAYDDADPGVIGIYDAAAGYARLGDIGAGGVGPHDIRLMPDGETLVVAVGGIRTHPDTPRVKLNLADMDPSLTYIDSGNGAVLEQVRHPPALHQNSMRHLAVTGDGLVLCVQQWEGAPAEKPPLVALHRRGGPLRLLEAPAEVTGRLRNYCGSCCVDASGRVGVVSAPRGGLVTLWDLAEERYLAAVEMPDGCGVAADGTPGGFVVTSGAGGALRHGHGPLPGTVLDLRRWDNHLIRLA
ncbi:DUF1513 domain-containing protein [Novispirillum sp. DQ9]|uniref:DUF1513 domain-containing protein n=1 Tax=Novispirillum sp. DQ9 TaxID=3398612 RepID=UPI003C797C45